MDLTIQAAIDKSQNDILSKLSEVLDSKMSSLKRDFIQVAESSHSSQIAEIKKMKLMEPRTFKKKGHEKQYKHNEKVQITLEEAKIANASGNTAACDEKLNQGMELINHRQKLILMADSSDCGWKTVSEYEEHELADDEADAKRIKKAEKEAQRKLTESRSKIAKNKKIPWHRKFSQAPSSFQQFYPSPSYQGISVMPQPISNVARPFRRSGTCFGCGKLGHWRTECPLIIGTAQQAASLGQSGARVANTQKLSMPFEECISLCISSKHDSEELEVSSSQDQSSGNIDTSICSKDQSELVSPKGRLEASFQYWELLNPSKFILDVIKLGYKIPLITLPENIILSNNRSALNNESFVSSEIEKLISLGCVSKVLSIPTVVNPLSVSIREDGKKRLILDLRHVNPHLFKFKFKCEDVDTFSQMLLPNQFLFAFDIKSAYHHVQIFKEHCTFLGFSWKFQGYRQFFQFNVLPFGLSSAPYLFTKLLRPIVGKWRGEGKSICVYFDDGIGANSTYNSAKADSVAIRSDLIQLGFLLSESKCHWDPKQIVTWLGHVFNMLDNKLYITPPRVLKLKESISSLLDIYSSNPTELFQVKRVAHITGQIVSMSRGIGPWVFLHSRHLYYTIESRSCWSSSVSLSREVVKELYFWLQNVDRLNGLLISTQPIRFDNFVFSDASSSAYGGYTISNGRTLLCQGNWSGPERANSSTWRELKAVDNMLLSMCGEFKHHNLQWFTDNQNIVRIIPRGSMKKDLHALAVNIFQTCIDNQIQISPVWIPREMNVVADYLSKCLDTEDWSIQPHIFRWLDGLWGPFSIDRFATPYNSQCPRFNSRFWTPGCEAVDALSVSWQNENNWVVPPTSNIILAVKQFNICSAKGILIIPAWKSASFWTIICPDGVHFSECVTDWVGIPDSQTPCIVQGRAYSKIFSGGFLKFRMLGLKIDCTVHRTRSSNRGFCTSELGLCEQCA